MKKYGIIFEIGGTFGMFARPDSGSEACSYPIPPASACKCMIDAILRIKETTVTIVAVGVCSYPAWIDYSFNSHSPLRKSNTIKDNQSCQLRITALENPRYQILAYVTENDHKGPINYAHSFQDQFFRRLKRGQCFYPVSLGWKEMMADYVGIPKTPIISTYNTIMETFSHGDYNNVDFYSPKRQQLGKSILNAKIKNGIFQFTEDAITVRDGKLNFSDSQMNEYIERMC